MPQSESSVPGLICIFPGIEGTGLSLIFVQKAFRDAGVSAELRTIPWGVPLGSLKNLTSHERNRSEAAVTAEEIAAYARLNPKVPIQFVDYSGGGAMAVMVAEALPADVRLKRIILVQAALSRAYDLTPAFNRIDGELINFHSAQDTLVLGVGTTTFGTMDRVYEDAAGKDGFLAEKALADPLLRSRLTQVPWSSQMATDGHTGGHANIIFYRWNRKYVAPYLLNAEGC